MRTNVTPLATDEQLAEALAWIKADMDEHPEAYAPLVTPDTCVHCGATLADDGDCDRCQAAWERGEVIG